MAKSNHGEHRWIDDRLESIAPRGFDPDVKAGLIRLRDRTSVAAGRRPRMWIAVAATACAIALLLPWPRAAAQRLWNSLMVAHIEVVHVDRPDVPDAVMAFFQMNEREPMVPEPVASLDDAERLAGFRPLLPAPGVLAGTPALAVVQEAALSTAPIRVNELRALLRRINAGVDVPSTWEGASLMVEGGPIVVADYPDAGVQVMQAGPLRLTMPPDLQLERFMEVAFRVFGRTADEARRFAIGVAANPPLLMVLTPGHNAVVREISFGGGTGILAGDPAGDGGMCLFLNTPGRLYFISADRLTEERALAIARSLQ
jgi:hypothetical protein